VFVTHDQEEALEVADRVVVMNHGKIEQIGSPDEVYSSPASPFVYQFLGNVNVFHSRVQGGYAEVERHAAAEKATAFVRPHDIDIAHQAADGALQATVAMSIRSARWCASNCSTVARSSKSNCRASAMSPCNWRSARRSGSGRARCGCSAPTTSRGGAGKAGFPVLIRGKSGGQGRML
jgi:ABC-type sulfate/molybdate transport systems ATPase subunit